MCKYGPYRPLVCKQLTLRSQKEPHFSTSNWSKPTRASVVRVAHIIGDISDRRSIISQPIVGDYWLIVQIALCHFIFIPFV